MDLNEIRAHWKCKRNTTLRDRIFEELERDTRTPATLEWSASVLQQIPVEPNAAAKKKALIAELKLAARDYKALMRKVQSFATAAKGLPVVD